MTHTRSSIDRVAPSATIASPRGAIGPAMVALDASMSCMFACAVIGTPPRLGLLGSDQKICHPMLKLPRTSRYVNN